MSNENGKINKFVRYTNIPKDGKTFMTIPEFCKKYHLTKTTVRRRINARRLRAFKLKGKWYVKPY